MSCIGYCFFFHSSFLGDDCVQMFTIWDIPNIYFDTGDRLFKVPSLDVLNPVLRKRQRKINLIYLFRISMQLR